MEHIKRRTFTFEFKLKVLQEALKNGIEVTLRKYSITPKKYISLSDMLKSEDGDFFIST